VVKSLTFDPLTRKINDLAREEAKSLIFRPLPMGEGRSRRYFSAYGLYSLPLACNFCAQGLLKICSRAREVLSIPQYKDAIGRRLLIR
jgi:hypothetical protein